MSLLTSSATIYSDLNQNLDTPLVTDMESIHQSITNILTTRGGERLFLPEFGASLEELLFELIDDITTYRIYDLVVRSITFWEPRIFVVRNQTFVSPDPQHHMYHITLTFTIKGLSNTQMFEYKGNLIAA